MGPRDSSGHLSLLQAHTYYAQRTCPPVSLHHSSVLSFIAYSNDRHLINQSSVVRVRQEKEYVVGRPIASTLRAHPNGLPKDKGKSLVRLIGRHIHKT